MSWPSFWKAHLRGLEKVCEGAGSRHRPLLVCGHEPCTKRESQEHLLDAVTFQITFSHPGNITIMLTQ